MLMNDDVEPITKSRKNRLWQAKTQILATLSVSCISLIIGYSVAYTAPAEISMELDFSLTKNEVSRIVGLLRAGALIGGLMGGFLVEKLGRKWTLFITDLIFFVSWIVTYLAKDFHYLYGTRLCIGLGVGVGSLVLPVYIVEISQPKLRGILGMVPTVLGNVGILGCYMFGVVWQWQILALIAIFLCVPYFLVGLFLVPETPIWYITKSRDEDGRKSLSWLRKSQTKIEEEFMDLKSHTTKNHITLNEVFHSNIKPLLIIMGLMFFQQMTGINAVISYTTKIFEAAGSSFNTGICTIIVGVANFISTFLAILLVDKLGRRILLYTSSIAMLISLTSLGIYFYLKTTNDYGWVPLILLIIYILGFSLGFGPIPWLLMGEILPSKTKATAAAIATSFNWFCNYMVTRSFLLIMEIMGEYGIFWMYAGFVLLALIFITCFVPETKGKTLLEIEKLFVN